MKRCYKCRRQFSDQNLIIKGRHKYCHTCFNKYFMQDEQGNFITIGDSNVYECKKCGKVITKQIHEDLDGMCPICFSNAYHKQSNDIIKCLKCGRFHLYNENCECIRQMDFHIKDGFTYYNEHTSWHYKGNRIRKDINLDTAKIQELRPYDEEVDEYLNIFYHRSDDDFHWYPCKWKDINEEGTIKFINTNLIKTVINSLKLDKDYKRDKIISGYEINKYADMELTGVKDGKLEWTKINLMGKKIVSYESVNKFLETHGYDESKAQLSGVYKYRMSTDIKHKLLGLQVNEKFRSCQHSSNSNTYALGAYDFITNGCNAPILIYKEGSTTPVGRMLCRIMYDRKGIEYLLVERLYHNGEFGSQGGSDSSRGHVIKAIIEDLIKKGYNVLVSPYSAHDESMYTYLMTMGMNTGKAIITLSQPARVMYKECGYYCDGGTKVGGMDFGPDGIKQLEDKGINKTGKELREEFSTITLGIDSLSKGYLLSL